MENHPIPRKLWEHPDPKSTLMYKLMQTLNAKHNLQLKVKCRNLDLVCLRLPLETLS